MNMNMSSCSGSTAATHTIKINNCVIVATDKELFDKDGEHNLRKIDGQSHLWSIKFKWMINKTWTPKIMDFEARRRRLAVLCAHLCPSRFDSRNTHIVSTSNCSSNTSNLRLDCVFCQIIQGYSPAFKIYEDDTCLCILDTNPLSRGHSLLIPKRHYCSLDVTPPSVIASMCSKIPFISNAIKKATGCDSFNLLVNNGAAAGQVIFHTHIHIIPRKMHDSLWASESLRRLSLKLDQDAPRLAESIREHIVVANNEENKDQGSDLAGISRD